MSYYYSPPPPPPSPSPSPPPPPHSPTLPYYPYYSPPPPSPDCNMTTPPPPPPKLPNCTMPPPSPPITYNCTCICPTPPITPTCPPYHYPPSPPVVPYSPPYHKYNYTVEHDYKAVIAVSVSLGGILVAFLFLGVFFLAKKKKPVVVPPPPPPPSPPPQPSYQYGAVPQTATSTYEAIEIIEEAGGDDAAGGQSYEPVNPGPVPHDYGHQNYG